MSHPFGELLRQYLHRKHGLSQARLAAGIGQPPFVVSLMCRGERLARHGARKRVLVMIGWLHEQGALTTCAEAQARLTTAGLPGFDPVLPGDAHLLHALESADPWSAADDQLPSALPAVLGSFVGRAEECATVPRLLEISCLLTLTGPGGVGKMRLALEVVAAAVHGDYAHAVCYVSLAPIVDPALVISAVGTRCGYEKFPAGRWSTLSRPTCVRSTSCWYWTTSSICSRRRRPSLNC